MIKTWCRSLLLDSRKYTFHSTNTLQLKDSSVICFINIFFSKQINKLSVINFSKYKFYGRTWLCFFQIFSVASRDMIKKKILIYRNAETNISWQQPFLNNENELILKHGFGLSFCFWSFPWKVCQRFSYHWHKRFYNFSVKRFNSLVLLRMSNVGLRILDILFPSFKFIKASRARWCAVMVWKANGVIKICKGASRNRKPFPCFDYK